MMNEWLKAQAQKQQPSTRSIELRRQGMSITEQLTPKEEKFAKANRHILSEMVKRYGSDKGTQLFYNSVREQVKKLNENSASIDNTTEADAERKVLIRKELKQKSTIKSKLNKDQAGNNSAPGSDHY
jgi:hypothetical protein